MLNAHVGCSKDLYCGSWEGTGVKSREVGSGLTLNAVVLDNRTCKVRRAPYTSNTMGQDRHLPRNGCVDKAQGIWGRLAGLGTSLCHRGLGSLQRMSWQNTFAHRTLFMILITFPSGQKFHYRVHGVRAWVGLLAGFFEALQQATWTQRW